MFTPRLNAGLKNFTRPTNLAPTKLNTQTQITCLSCAKPFTFSEEAQNLRDRLLRVQAPMMMVKCPHCWISTSFSLEPPPATPAEPSIFRCPIAGCVGNVGYIESHETDRLSFWACGYCATFWESKALLDHDIEKIIARRAYRAGFYLSTPKGYLPTECDLDEQTRVLIGEEDNDAN